MLSHKLTRTTIASLCLLAGAYATFAPDDDRRGSRFRDRVKLQQLQSAFHGASAAGDFKLMRSIWTRDAVFRGGPNVVKGRDNIADFFRRGPNWGKTANLAPTYKSIFKIRGRKATIRFECVIVKVDGSSPLTTALSTLPPGSQNKKVEIVQHSNTTIQAVKRRGRWLIKSFTGTGGPIK